MHPELIRALAHERRADFRRQHLSNHAPGAGRAPTKGVSRHVRNTLGRVLIGVGGRIMVDDLRRRPATSR